MLALIEKKQAGRRLSADEIGEFVRAVRDGSMPDYQVSALLMAIYFKGLDHEETYALTKAIVDSGDILSFPNELRPVLDKHSTGGVGDKTSLILVPLLSASGYRVCKMSGRGLAHTGGTIDKLESIPGYCVELPAHKLIEQVGSVGCAIVSQSNQMVPVEKKLYALRNATATVNSLPLIISSILSKKVAGGADAVVIDVKCGSGAFFKTYTDAVAFSSEISMVARRFPISLTTVVSDMEQPLGNYIGNALEVKEVIDLLSSGDPNAGLCRLAIRLGVHAMRSVSKIDEEEAVRLLSKNLSNGSAMEKFEQMVSAQGGDLKSFNKEMENIEAKTEKLIVKSPSSGIVSSLDAYAIGKLAHMLGGGRETTEQQINPWVGVRLLKKAGQPVVEGEALAEIYAPKDMKGASGQQLDAEDLQQKLLRAYEVYK